MATGEKFLGSYEQKSSPEDTDLLVGYDVTNSKTKNFKLSAIWTWIKAKIGTAAFCSVVNNLTTAAEGGVLDARQGKALSDSLSKLNSLVGTTSISGIGGGTITGAISELNSNQAITITNVKISIFRTEITLLKAGNIVVISYCGDTIDSVKRGDLQVIGTIPPDYVPRQRIVIAPIQSVIQRIQLTFEKNGNITAYNYGDEITAQTACRYNGCYVC